MSDNSKYLKSVVIEKLIENDAQIFEDVTIEEARLNLFLNGEKTILKYDYQTKQPTTNGGDLWKVTVYDKQFETPTWAKGKLIYHIFVDRFSKINII